MRLHKEGKNIIFGGLVLFLGLDALAYFFIGEMNWLMMLVSLTSLVFIYLIIQFFRVPKRTKTIDANSIVSPCDGKVVVIEEVEETEYFKEKRIQISVFMSPLNVHVNWYPLKGIVKYAKYHAGLFLVAWHPKSSTDNERTTVVVEHASGKEVLFRQIAGALARRIVLYAKEGDKAEQCEEFGFIKFGSRVDLFLPLDADVKVKIGDKVQGTITTLAKI